MVEHVNTHLIPFVFITQNMLNFMQMQRIQQKVLFQRTLGSTMFKRLFKSITFDNGVEFSDVKGWYEMIKCL